MPKLYEIRAYGEPETQGSMRAFTPKGWKRPIITSANPKLKYWRAVMLNAALGIVEAGIGIPDYTDGKFLINGPVVAQLVFSFERPRGTPITEWPVTRSSGDLDKLIRAVFDSLTEARVWEDDSRCVKHSAMKLFCGQGPDALDRPGVIVRVRAANPPPGSSQLRLED